MNLDFSKSKEGLLPAIVQDRVTGRVLMLGYMNQKAIDATLSLGKVTFFSRSKNRLWTKGEESGNFLIYVDMKSDCDGDAILVYADPVGFVCHKGTDTCWGEKNEEVNFLKTLENIIHQRKEEAPENSYVSSLFQKGINKIAQKVGEEAVEVVIEAKDTNDELFLSESADLLFHYLILLQAKGYSLEDVVSRLKMRHKS